MVSRLLTLGLILCPALAFGAASPASATAASSTAGSLSVTAESAADADFPATPATPRLPQFGKNDPAEDFLVVTTISLPFMGLYALLGATAYAVAKSDSHAFPPAYDSNLVTTAAAVAVGASFTIAAVSVNWGGGTRNAKNTSRIETKEKHKATDKKTPAENSNSKP